MTYSNILYRKGYFQFAEKAKESGIDGFIIPDIPVEESKEYLNTMQNIGMSTIFLVSPNTSEKRLKRISRILLVFCMLFQFMAQLEKEKALMNIPSNQ